MKRLLLFLLLAAPCLAQQTGQNLTGALSVASASCVPANSCVWMKIPAYNPQLQFTDTVTVTGTWSGTLVIESAVGGAWKTVQTLTSNLSATAFTVTGLTDFRVRMSAYTSGTANITVALTETIPGGGGGAPSGQAPSGNMFYMVPGNCTSLSNCISLKDDDSTDNCGTALTNWFTAINASTTTAEIYIQNSGLGFKFISCTWPTITVSNEIHIDGRIDFVPSSPPTYCFEEMVSGNTNYNTPNPSIWWRIYGGTLAGCQNATGAGFHSNAWTTHDGFFGTRFDQFGPSGNTAGTCTKSSVYMEAFAELKLDGIDAPDARLGSCFGRSDSANGQNTVHITASTITDTNGAACGSVGWSETGSHSSFVGNSFWGWDVPILFANNSSGSSGAQVVGGTYDSAGCTNGAVSAAFQLAGVGAVGPLSITGVEMPTGAPHSTYLVSPASGSTATLKSATITGNIGIFGGTSGVMPSTLTCTNDGTFMCNVLANQGFVGAGSADGAPNNGWAVGVGLMGGTFLSNQSADISGSVNHELISTNSGATAVSPPNPIMIVSCYLVVTQQATTSATLPQCVINWTDATTSVATTYTCPADPSPPANPAVGYAANGCVRPIWVKASTVPFVTTTGYASSGATPMKFTLFVRSSSQ